MRQTFRKGALVDVACVHVFVSAVTLGIELGYVSYIEASFFEYVDSVSGLVINYFALEEFSVGKVYGHFSVQIFV